MENISRQQKISDILSDLATLKTKATPDQLYAIEENVKFFEASRSAFSYIKWLFGRARVLDGSRLLEINDLLPKYDEAMHRKLVEMESKKFPGLVKPLVDKLLELILSDQRDLIIADVGSGGMEVERQVIIELNKINHSRQVIFIGIDQSISAQQVAKDNLKKLGDSIQIIEVKNLDQTKLFEIKTKPSKKPMVVLCQNDIFNLDKDFNKEAFDISFHTLFKHHLTSSQAANLDAILKNTSKKVLEYDGFYDPVGMIPQTLIGWSNPVFLNAEILSNIRFIKKITLKNIKKDNELKLSKIGYYLSVEK